MSDVLAKEQVEDWRVTATAGHKRVDDGHWRIWQLALSHEALRAERDAALTKAASHLLCIEEMAKELATLRAQVEASSALLASMRPVVEAAERWCDDGGERDIALYPVRSRLADAVAAYRALAEKEAGHE